MMDDACAVIVAITVFIVMNACSVITVMTVVVVIKAITAGFASIVIAVSVARLHLCNCNNQYMNNQYSKYIIVDNN